MADEQPRAGEPPRAGRAQPVRVSRVVVDLGRPGPGGAAYRIEAPDRVLRMWFLLNAVAEERLLTALPPPAQVHIQAFLRAVRGELEHAVSPALAGELHRLLGWGEHGPEAAEVRVAYASLLGWAGGLVIAMLSQLEAARSPGSGHTGDAGGARPGTGGGRAARPSTGAGGARAGARDDGVGMGGRW